MKEIKLTKGKVALVDDDDFERINQHKWHALPAHRTFYAVRNDLSTGVRKYVYMHKEIMNTPEGMETDHVDIDGLNNQKENLRIATANQNCQNRRPLTVKSSRFKGVSRRGSAWIARITVNRKLINLGYFRDELRAASAYNCAARAIFGEFARTGEGENA
jgi:hypothetical protein